MSPLEDLIRRLIAREGPITVARYMALALAPYGIRVNTVSPGATETPMIAEYTNESRQNAANKTMLGTIGEADQVADVARFLISDLARYVTGDVISASGGGSV